jgi:uncharacterized protein (DUF305 family)
VLRYRSQRNRHVVTTVGMRTRLFIVTATVMWVLSVGLSGCRPSNDAGSSTPLGSDQSNLSGTEANRGNVSNTGNTSNINTALALRTPDDSTDPFDLRFIDSMIYHHEATIQMANMVIGKTARPEMKTFARKLVDEQSREIDRLRELRSEWYAGRPSAIDMTMPGTSDAGMDILHGEHIKEMGEMEPNHFDNHFLNMMLPHHKGSIDMAREAEARGEHDELKKFAEQMIELQSVEVIQMKRWKATWKS